MEQCVSVIIPVYNTEEFLEDCLRSIVKQTYKNLQIIVVNDASTDQSTKIIDQFTAQDQRIEVIENNKRMGVGFSRNLAMQRATGEYIYFVDSDDLLHEQAIEKLLQEAQPETIYTGRIVKITKKDSIEASLEEQEKQEEQELFRAKTLHHYEFFKDMIVVNTLFPTHLIQSLNLTFDEKVDSYSEIAFMMPFYMQYKMVRVKSACYFRRDRNDPITNPSLNQRNRDELLQDFVDVYIRLKNHYANDEEVNKYLDKQLIQLYRSKFILLMKEEDKIEPAFHLLSSSMKLVSKERVKKQNVVIRGELRALQNKQLKKYLRVLKLHHFGRDTKKSLKSLNKFYRQIYRDVFMKLPLKENKIVFASFLGKQYADSPKAIYEYMVEHYPEYEFVWIFNETGRKLPGNAKQVKRLSLAYYYHLATAKYWVSNMRQPLHLKKREGNIFLETWHGTPLKRLVFDMDEVYSANPKYKKNFYQQSRLWDYLIAANPYSSKIFRSAFKFEKKMLEYGYPRNDTLYKNNNEEYITKVKKSLDIPLDKKVILYAPTWRDDEFYEAGKYKFDLKFDLQKLREKLGNDYIIILRMHYFIADNLNIDGYEGFIYNLSKYDDIADLYLISDMLITDYSSVFFDYSNLRRPILFYAYDLENYRDKLRGFYLDYENQMPGPIVKTTDEMIDAIQNIDQINAQYKDKYNNFYDQICCWETGNATEKIVHEVFKKSSKPKEHQSHLKDESLI
ncbi:bifunctional glycosyltransferase/CDP-glycerol:glycerophosphate glycerophosphotransferase [Rummeliibacillus pycnus]|uniref:bifunctional glycosyltransferase/CDP-glycerol:glycerophosphate glycerophosphotransferase n=1 Tax=Rummeliibacillus pycnus TaxID=101070 RepID=UPI000C99822A|nr:CDP-glycerol:glycerophosphate glycerophosphotransferase [Rummeliibacillus pycnus]